jgi:hydrogenase nickel incorporation protein HypA/HybF
MHELSLARRLAELATAHANGQRVRRVTLRVGQLAGVDMEALRFSFGVCCQGRLLADAVLDIEPVAGYARCRACQARMPLAHLWDACDCGSHDLELLAGDELVLASMEFF